MTDQLSLCACGCGRPANRSYLPGHDSKHVSKLRSLVLDGQMTRREATKQLSSRSLRDKLRGLLDAS